MPSWNVRRYRPHDRSAWDAFVRQSKNGTFLFLRDYMDYHAERFQDHSLLVSDDHGTIQALLPVNEDGEAVVSHGGLTYGGFVSSARMTLGAMEEIVDGAARQLAESGFKRLIYKTIPHIYHVVPAEEDLYVLHDRGARILRRDVLSVLETAGPAGFHKGRRWGVRKAEREGLAVRETSEYERFWEILVQNLWNRHHVQPTHTVEEMKLLAIRFPEEIRLVGGYEDREMLAGAVVYVSRNVCHVQYTGVSERGREAAALDQVLAEVVETFGAGRRYVDFGISTEEDGRHLNRGLAAYKEGFGARSVVHDFYELALGPAARPGTGS